MKIAIIGSGYVGLTTGACFAEVGHEVLCVDNDQGKVKSLREGLVPFYEPGLEAMIARNVAAGRLRFGESIAEAVESSLALFIAVPTPPREDGSVDLHYVEKVAREIAGVLHEYRVVVDKSTVPVRTGEKVAQTIERYSKQKADFDVVSNPEFLREGSAISDLMNPDRIVIGASSERAIAIMKEIYQPFRTPVLITDVNSAELIKHASNSFLAVKISYINMISQICEASKADVLLVAEGMGLDRRIGRSFLQAGLGWGGSCFPKDVSAFIRIAEELGCDFRLLKEAASINRQQRERFLKKIREEIWLLRDKTIGLLGLAFKNNTDDTRQSVAMALAENFIQEGAVVRAYDPKAMAKAKQALPELHLCSRGEEVAQGADCVVVATEWEEFRELDWLSMKKRMVTPLVFDGRNLLDREKMAAWGFTYRGIGR
ncbi:UDP-glucose 6-dehydrogenase TuaD [Methylacidimicrobium sp. AP8]|uniref:UDP-glucose dehydrogenase family protein n=1 Tax=Methylacidimicrobium sp. AP8 TaxID=2730359 RepID=UPI0018BFF53A|nr:UDP-glucose/GDP-mannose dehydrogenase family protein [Methylacidimicrobium sp. AP8]CAB4242365.1 UDP-glucose 6-dehydrogenase TuaD [Methylacidimicrobium sp. AP8]